MHGYLASRELMLPLRHRLRRLGHDAHLAREVAPLVMGDVRVHAAELDAAVERVRARTGAERIDVVGASQGGIIALWWAHAHGGWDRLGRMVALGTPFRGAKLAKAVAPAVGLVSPAIRQLVPGSPFLDALTGIPLERPVISVSMRGDPVCPPPATLLPGMEQRIVDATWGPLTHQLLMLDPRTSRATHEALTC